MLNSSFIEPPGWITAVIPALSAISTQSGNGKKASLAITDPLRSKLKELALSIHDKIFNNTDNEREDIKRKIQFFYDNNKIKKRNGINSFLFRPLI